MEDEKTYEWKFDLEEYAMTTDVLEDYKAQVVTKSLNINDVIRSITAERTDLRPETLATSAQLIDNKIIELVSEGNSVSTGTALYLPAILGVFMGNKGIFDPAKNSCTVNINPSAALRNKVSKVKAKFSGNVKSSGGARISLVKDIATGKTDGTITSGGMLDITGSKIKSINADGTGIGKVCFINAETKAEAGVVALLGINAPSRLVFNAPALADGAYILQIETYFSNSKILLKQARILEYPILLYVGARPGDRPGIL